MTEQAIKTAEQPEAAESDLYRYQLSFYDDQGAEVHQQSLEAADFERAKRETFFEAFRQGHVSSYSPALEQARVEPRFAGTTAPARCDGFRVSLAHADGDFSLDFPHDYFGMTATTVRAGLKAEGKLTDESTWYYSLDAYLEDVPPASSSPAFLSLDPATHLTPVRDVDLCQQGPLQPWDDPADEDLPVLISRTVIEDGCDEAARNPDREVGGLLLGHLCRDPESGKGFLLVNCLVPAKGTSESTSTSVTLTEASFAKARELIPVRAQTGVPPEMIVGWFHSHPFRFCAACPLPTPKECIDKILFFSQDDLQLMESTFDQPFMVGLLAGVEPKLENALGHLPVRLYGWRKGKITSRGFSVIDQ